MTALMAHRPGERLADLAGFAEVGETEVCGREAPERLWKIRQAGRVSEEMPV